MYLLKEGFFTIGLPHLVLLLSKEDRVALFLEDISFLTPSINKIHPFANPQLKKFNFKIVLDLGSSYEVNNLYKFQRPSSYC